MMMKSNRIIHRFRKRLLPLSILIFLGAWPSRRHGRTAIVDRARLNQIPAPGDLRGPRFPLRGALGMSDFGPTFPCRRRLSVTAVV